VYDNATESDLLVRSLQRALNKDKASRRITNLDFGIPVQPKEWFLVPLEVIEEAIEKIKEGTLDRFRYDRETVSLTRF
jgi:hypothetical protein